MTDRIDLAGKWRLSQVKGKIKVDANLPGDNYSALLRAGKIPDPYFGMNEDKVQWVADEDWEYSRDFNVKADLLAKKSVFMNIENIDTFADIYINSKKVFSTENMFRRYRIEVKKFLKAGKNTIRILIQSPVEKAADESVKAPWLAQMRICGHHKAPFMNHIRKAQCHAGWDWGISLITSGIYNDIYLQGSDCGRIEHVYTEQEHSSKSCKVTVIAEYEAIQEATLDMEIKLAGKVLKEKIEVAKGLNIIRKSIVVDNPDLWWPAGYGKQHLYELSVEIDNEIITKRLGLRKIELITEKDKIGESMFFRMNGVPVFCKGANWIPADAMTERITTGVYRRLVQDAATANMNMLRVWGGGQYEKEEFYDACDEFGILLWHDLMFACMLYPTHREFMDNVKEEVTYQVKRIRSHASLAVWCGDNEITGAVSWYSDGIAEKREQNLLNYDRMNQLLWRTVEESAGNTARFWPASPCNGYIDSGECWKDETRGDFHHWSVFDKGIPLFDAYRSVKPRFVSEFGFQSIPEMKTIKKFASEGQYNLTSPEFEKHQKCGYATAKVLETIASYFRVPAKFEDSIYITQLLQALVLKNAVEYWRSLMPRCMGVLYWQINDNWPVLSWASIDYFGNWKQAHYHAKRFFAPLMICAYQLNKDEVEIWAVNDASEKLDISASLKLVDFEGLESKKQSYKFSFDGAGARKLATLAVDKFVSERNQFFLYMEISGKGKKGVSYSHANEHFFTEYKRCELADAKVDYSIKNVKDKYFVILKTDKPVFFLNLETENSGIFSDNSFTLLPGTEKLVEYEARDGKPLKNLKIKHLKITT